MEFVELFDGVFQVLDFPCGGELDEEVHRLIEARNRAREREDWEEADRIRERLHRLGVHLVDTPSRTFWFLRRNSDERI
jgi:cysteinyl-tRNA synthetase